MNKSSINNFVRGLNKDTDKSIVASNSYLDAYNFRIVTSEGSSSGALENIKGNIWLGDILPADQLICGSIRLRDYIILFTTSNTSTPVHGSGRNMIYKLTLDKANETYDTLTLLYDDYLNTGGGSDTLDFSISNKIKALAKYETPNIQKIYWVDSFNHIRYANVASNLTVTGATYSTPGDYMSTDKFEFLPAFIPSVPTLKDIVGGNLLGGTVQYAYQLYRLNGAETAFSPVSDMIHIVSDSDFSTNTKNYKGDKESTNTGKGCRISIVNSNTGYDRLRLVRIRHSTLNSIPVIAVANEIEISTSPTTVEITDVGDTVSSLTLDEFNISSTELFKCGDIAIKDNMLFAANIEKSEFTIDTDDWDARAVRFKLSSTATVKDSIQGDVVILANLSNWSSYTEDHDGINEFNDYSKTGDSAYEWKYQANGTTIGAEGPNVKIDFATESISLDTSGSNTTFSATPSTSSSDKSYKNYASPWKGGKLSWQRDEVYRLFVVFGNDRGQRSDPKWICDLRMPSLHDDDFYNGDNNLTVPSSFAINSSPTVYSYRLFPRIHFKSFPSDASYAQIYRVKRDRGDRSIVTQALAIPSQLISGVYYPDELYKTLPDNVELIKLVSPEINITKNISKQANDYIEYATNYNSGYTETSVLFSGSSDAYTFGHIDKLHTNAKVSYTANCVSIIDDAFPISPAISAGDEVLSIDSKSYSNYNNNSAIYAKGSTGLLVAYGNSAWSAEGVRNVVVNYRSNVYGSQYGGHTFEDRALNISIPCSGIITSANVGAYVSIPYGDTFINFFDVSTLLADLTKEKYQDTWSETVFVPLESSINCDLRHDIESGHMYTIPTSFDGYKPYLRQEYPGDHVIQIHGSDRTFNQTEDLYLYNTIYSQQTSAQYAVSLMLDTPDETSFDCLVRASVNKHTGELSDSWTKFHLNEEIEVDSNYGSIRSLVSFNDKLLFLQDDAFGILSVNTRSLIQDGSSSELVLGTGGVLDRYDYISSNVGILDKFTVVTSDQYVYWFYDKDSSIYRFSGQLENIAKSKSMWSWFKNTYMSDYSVHGVHDRDYNEVIYTLYKDSDATGYTLAFNEQTDQFTSFYNFVPRLYIDYKDGYLSVRDFNTQSDSYMFMHNSNINPRGRFYSLLAYTSPDANNTYDSTIKILYNADYPYTKVFDNLTYISNAFDDSTDVEQYGITFDRLRCYNDYQNTDWVDLTYPTNIMRRERGWTIAIPRNMVDGDYTTSPDIFTDLVETKTWAERIRDKYMILDLSFDNTNETRFVVPFIGLKYRISFR